MIFDRTSYINQPLPIENELRSLFNLEEPLIIFEIGACEGEDSIKYSRLFKNASIYAFEPLPNNIKHIEANIKTHNVDRVTICNIALSSEIGSASFYVSEGTPENGAGTDWDFGNKSSSLLAPDKHTELASFIEFKQQITVETTTLEAFCKSNRISLIDYIHMDVQGAELMVLNGAGNFIQSIKAIWLEVSTVHVYKDQPLSDDIDKFMHENGFALVKDCLQDIQGDRLYISKRYFPEYKNIEKRFKPKKPNLFIRALKKVINFK